jgi:uncharacterized delta-60 repeat protein
MSTTIFARHCVLTAFFAVTVILVTQPAQAAPGDLDPTFDIDGKVTTELSGSSLWARRGTLLADDKIIVVGESSGDFAIARYDTIGTLDAAFGIGGILLVDLGSGDAAFDVAIQSDGKIVAVGAMGGGDFALIRLNEDGDLDTAFDGDGIVTTNFAGGDGAFAVAIQPDGKIVAAGIAENPSLGIDSFAIARYNLDGSLDTTFGVDGKVTIDFGGFDRAADVAIQEDGKIVVAGTGGTNTDFAIARLNGDGTSDPSFGTDGKVLTDLAGFDHAEALALQKDGKILVVGFGIEGFTVARYNVDGNLDIGFGDDGIVVTQFVGESTERGHGVAVQADGKIVAVGFAFSSFDPSFAIARYETDGSLDASFGNNGKITTDFGDPADVGVLCPPARKDCSNDFARDVAIQGDGKIVAIGSAGPGTPSPFFAVARYLGDPTAIVIHMDVKPGSKFGTLNPRSKGVIPVAVRASAEFDATQVDFSTIAFGPSHASPAHDGHIADINGDGFVDVLFHFRTQEAGFDCDDDEAVLTGMTFGGESIWGTDEIETVGCQ